MSESDVEAGTAISKGMPAEFGQATATFVIVASMVGVGVLTTSGYTVYFVGSNLYMLGLWILGGVIAVCGALTLAELSAALPRTGGDYVYLYEAYGPLPAFLSGWVSFLIGFSAPSAAAAFGAAKYLTVPLHLDEGTGLLVQRALATIAVLAFALVHTSGRRQTAHVQGWITALKVTVLLMFVLAGLAVGAKNYGHFRDPVPLTAGTGLAMLSSLVYVTYAYIGWNASSYLAGEVAEPQRRLPRAILLGTGLVTLLYLGLNTVYGLALSAADVRAIVNDPANTLKDKADAVAPIAQLAAQRLFGARWSDPFSVAVGLMLLSSLSAYVLTGPRVIYAMAHAGQFPAIAGHLTRRAGTPGVATLLQIAVALALLWTGSFDSIVVYASVGLSLFSILSMSSIYVLRWKQPNLPRPFRTPGYPATPAVYLVLTALLTWAAFDRKRTESLYALGSILAGIPVYYLWKYGRAPR
ncbi:MAG: amino acid permease [Isosphaeraceae bacterium]|nr:amino acid permease [Isosphaeraceae bacterium]